MIVQPSELELEYRRTRDRALVEAHCNGDTDAFAVIVGDHYRVLLAQAERRLGSRSEAEDAVQEAFERAFRALCRFGAGGEYRLGAWLSRIVANVCADHGGRRVAERRLPERVAVHDVPSSDPFDSVSDPAVLRAVQDAIAALPSSQRDTFLLHEVDGLSYPQLAEHLEISEENARARVHRAKAALRRSLALTRATLGAIVAIPVGLRSLVRRARGVPDTGGAELSAGGSPMVGATATQTVAMQVANSPVGQAVLAVAPSGAVRGSVLAGIAGLAITGALAVPVVTSGNSSSPAAKTGEDTSAVFAAADATTTTMLSDSTAPPSTSPNPTVSSSPLPTTLPSAAAQPPVADPEATYGWALGLPDFFVGEPLEPASLCAAAAEPADVGVAAQAVMQVASELQLQPTEIDASSNDPYFEQERSLGPDAGSDAGSPLTVRAQACFVEEGAALVVHLASGSTTVRLDGRAAIPVADEGSKVYIFQGHAARTDDASGELPWGVRQRFAGRLQINGSSAQLTLVFYSDDDTPPGSSTPKVLRIVETPLLEEGAAPVNRPSDPEPNPTLPSGDAGEGGSTPQ